MVLKKYYIPINHINLMDSTRDKSLTKMEITEQFSKLFEDQDNSSCFHCAKKSRQWAETKHAIFLCLSCAANFKEINRVTSVKSISLDLWNEHQLELLRLGGNKRFKQFLRKYEFETTEPKVILRTKAAEHYRQLLLSQINKTQPPSEPALQQGKEPLVQQIPLTEMTSDEILKEAKLRLSWAGDQSIFYGQKAYNKVHHKITSGELKQDAKKAGQKVSETAKSIWAFVNTKIDEIKKDKKKEEP